MQPDVLQFFGDDFFNFFRRLEPVFGQIQPDIFADGQRIEQRAGLEHQRHAVFRGDFRRADGFAVDEDFAGIRRFQADQVLEQNTFAAAARPHDDKNFAGPDFQINAVQHFLPAKTFVQAPHDEADAGNLVVRGVHCSKKRVSR